MSWGLVLVNRNWQWSSTRAHLQAASLGPLGRSHWPPNLAYTDRNTFHATASLQPSKVSSTNVSRALHFKLRLSSMNLTMRLVTAIQDNTGLTNTKCVSARHEGGEKSCHTMSSGILAALLTHVPNIWRNGTQGTFHKFLLNESIVFGSIR